MSVCIGILGATGKVGHVAGKYLEPDFQVLKAARSNIGGNNYYRVDADKDEELIDFAKKCDVVINAVGPSYEKSERIMKAVNNCNVSCIDLFGTKLIESGSSDNSASGDILNIIGAGCEPGITGAILDRLARNYEDGDQLLLIKGGEETGGVAALKDIILSSLSGYIMPNKVLKDGRLKERKMYGEIKEEVEGFGAYVYKDIIMDQEGLSVCNKYGVKDFEQYKSYADIASKNLITEGCVRYAVAVDLESRNRICEDIYNQQVNIIRGRKQWVSINAVLKKRNSYNSIIIRGKDSSYLSGLTAAIAAKTLLNSNKNRVKGMVWAYDFVDSEYLFECLKKAGVSITENTETTDNQVEYGEI